ncbi:MAG: Maf family protein [Phycisphaerae bacterium]
MTTTTSESDDPPRLDEAVATLCPPILLASRSPRRRELLAAAGVPHVAAAPVFDDSTLTPGDIGSPSHWVTSLAYLKAWSQACSHPEAPLVLGSDTACVLDGRLIGTPADALEAEGMIRAFMDRRHEVVTGVAIIDRRGGVPRRHLFADAATVHMGRLCEEELAAYLATGAWQGKAGGYNLMDRVRAGWPLTWQGDPTTIMGLPMNRLIGRLNTLIRDTPRA